MDLLLPEVAELVHVYFFRDRGYDNFQPPIQRDPNLVHLDRQMLGISADALEDLQVKVLDLAI